MFFVCARRHAAVMAFLGILGMAAEGNTAPRDPFVRIYDTRAPLADDFDSAATPESSGWRLVAEEDNEQEIAGDAVFENDAITVVVRKGGTGALLYTRDGAAWVKQATVRPVTGTAVPIESIELKKNAPDGVILHALYGGRDERQDAIEVELLVGQRFVRAKPAGVIGALRVDAISEFVVLPDFFADDIVVSAQDLPRASVELPSENFLLNLARGGDAIIMNVWGNSDQDVRVFAGRDGADARIEGVEIASGDGGSVWVAVLAEKGIWHRRDIAPSDKGQIIPLPWRPPFPAVWRVDWRRSDGLTDSWEMAVENPDGSFRKSDLFDVSRDSWTDEDWWAPDRPRWRWNTGTGSYWYPCWFDREGKAYLQPLEKIMEFRGPAVLYPISRSADTPLNRFSVADVVRATLGVGPCQYILDLEGQGMAFQGRPTCDIRDDLDALYGRGAHRTGQAEVHKALDDVTAFIELIRNRIEQYASFARETKAYLTRAINREGSVDPALLALFEPIKQLEEAIEKRRPGIHTPEYARELVDEFRRTLVDYEGPDALTRCKSYTSVFVQIGENQDHLVAECRLAVRVLRQRAALVLTEDPASAEVVSEIRKRTRDVLRAPVSYEAARH